MEARLLNLKKAYPRVSRPGMWAILERYGLRGRCLEAREVRITSSILADDTTILGIQGELEEGVNYVKEVMNNFEEKNNEERDERLIFGNLEGETTRMLGCWMGPNRMEKKG